MVLIAGFFPFYVKYRKQKLFKDALVGINAAAIGLVIAAVFLLYNRAVQGHAFFTVLSLLSFVAVGSFNVPAPVAILGCGVIGLVYHFI